VYVDQLRRKPVGLFLNTGLRAECANSPRRSPGLSLLKGRYVPFFFGSSRVFFEFFCAAFLDVWCTAQVHEDLSSGFPLFPMLELLDTMRAKRKILIHINNTNPILNEDSAERAQLAQHGIEVAWDGMHIDLSGTS